MKKSKIIALAMVSAIALTGAGYAAWGTVITDKTTLNTGNWSIVLENDALGDSLVAGDEVYGYNKTSTAITETGVISSDGYNKYDVADSSKLAGARRVNGTNYVYTIEPYFSGNTVNFSFYNMHPGTVAKTRFEARNYGSIPAKVANVSVVLNNGSALSTEQSALANAIVVNGKLYNHVGSGTAALLGTLPTDTKLSDLGSAIQSILAGKELAPQASINFGNRDGSELEVNDLEFKLPAAALAGNTGMNAKLPIDIAFDFVQYNQN